MLAPAQRVSQVYYYLRKRPSSALTGKLLREGDQPLELLARRAPVDRPGRCLDTFLEVARTTPRDEGGGGVHEDDVAPGARLAGEDRADDLGVLLAVAAAQVADRRAGHPEVLGPHGDGADDAPADLGDAALAGVRDLVEAVRAVDDEGPVGAELGEDARERLGGRGGGDPEP